MSLQDHFEQIAKQEMERRAREIEQATIVGFYGGLNTALLLIDRFAYMLPEEPFNFVEALQDEIRYYLVYPDKAKELYE